jgi:hypothetical protein
LGKCALKKSIIKTGYTKPFILMTSIPFVTSQLVVFIMTSLLVLAFPVMTPFISNFPQQI